MRDPRYATPFETFGKATPYASASLRQHVWTAPDTITKLADSYLGDWKLWWLIAEHNAIEDVRRVEPGTVLEIPERPLERGRYESG